MVGIILKKSNGLDEFYTKDKILDSINNIQTKNVSR